MPDQGGISTKAYFSPVRGEAGEVHRFTLDENVSTNFTYFTQKLTSLYPEITGKDIIITYRDRDGEDVRIGSDEELIEALLEAQTLKQDIFKVRVKAKTDKPTRQGRDEEPIHPGVICDGCNGSVKGSRYKCLICADYDLCSICEHKGIHVGHNMMKIDKPRASYNAPRVHLMSGFSGYPGCGKSGQWKRHCGAKREEQRAKAEGSSDADMKNLGEFLGNILGGYFGGCQQEGETKENGAQPKANEKKQEETRQDQKESNADEPAEIPDYFKDWYKLFSPSQDKCGADPMANMFSFFNGMAGNCNQGSGACGGSPGQNLIGEMFKQFCQGSGQNSSSKDSNESHPYQQLMNHFYNFMEKSCGGGEENFCENLISQLRSAISNPSISPADRDMFEGFLNNAEATQKEEERDSKTNSDASASAGDKSESNKMDTDTASTTAEASRIYPDLPTDPQEDKATEDMLVEQTLQHLLTMGYSNEGGWLEQLIRAKQGSINQVLEVLLLNRGSNCRLISHQCIVLTFLFSIMFSLHSIL